METGYVREGLGFAVESVRQPAGEERRITTHRPTPGAYRAARQLTLQQPLPGNERGPSYQNRPAEYRNGNPALVSFAAPL